MCQKFSITYSLTASFNSNSFPSAYENVIYGCITKHVARCRGYKGGFAWGFFLGTVGLLVVGFKPDLTQHRHKKPARRDY